MATTPATERARRGRPPRVEQVAARRRALLDAAGVVFRRDGFLAATVDSIAEAAGFTRGAVYSQFANKSDLFLTLLEERIEERAVGNDAATELPVDADGAMAFLSQGVSASVADPAWRLAVLEFRVVAARDAELNARYARVHDVAIESVSRALVGRLRRPWDRSTAAGGGHGQRGPRDGGRWLPRSDRSS